MATEMILRRMNINDATVHGFRSSFRDWAGNVSSFPREITETALAHVIGDKAEQAPQRRAGEAAQAYGSVGVVLRAQDFGQCGTDSKKTRLILRPARIRVLSSVEPALQAYRLNVGNPYFLRISKRSETMPPA
jgi:hypothetical protein